MRYISHDCKFEDIKQLVFSFEFLLSLQKVHDNKESNSWKFKRIRGNSNPQIMNHGPLNQTLHFLLGISYFLLFCVVCGVDFLGL